MTGLLPLLLLTLGAPHAGQPTRAPLVKPEQVVWAAGLIHDVVLVKLVEGHPGPPAVPGSRVVPLFHRAPELLRAERAAVDPDHRLADLTTWWRVEAPAGRGPQIATSLNRQPWVELASLALAPAPPPGDLAPTTPDLVAHQAYLGPAPDGFGFDAAADWPGGDGAHITVADLEYSWLPTHEDLESTVTAETLGHDIGLYQSHGTAVLGQLVAGDNGYGVVGMVPAATTVVVFPYQDAETYSLADAVDTAAARLSPGDVLLIEQQVYDPRIDAFLPVEWDPATFDAISLAVARGIVVVEPAANGGVDLDGAAMLGRFDRALQDSGAILVGGGASPLSGLTPRTWSPDGSSYGSRVDVQGWYDSVATAWTDEVGGVTSDLFQTDDRDPRQGYTSAFSGTSAAAPLVAGVCAVANSVAVALHGEPLDPLDLRALLVSTGTPQPAEDAASYPIGPQPDLRAVLRYGLLP